MTTPEQSEPDRRPPAHHEAIQWQLLIDIQLLMQSNLAAQTATREACDVMVQRFTPVEARLATAESRLAHVEDQLRQLVRAVEANGEQLKSLVQHIGGLTAGFKSLYDRVFWNEPTARISEGNAAEVIAIRGPGTDST